MLNIPNNCLTLIDSECVTQYICTIQAQSVLCLYTESVTSQSHSVHTGPGLRYGGGGVRGDWSMGKVLSVTRFYFCLCFIFALVLFLPLEPLLSVGKFKT